MRIQLRDFQPFVRARPTAACLFVLVAAVVAVYGRTVPGYFMGDDFANVVVARQYPFSEWPKLFVRDIALDIWGPGPLPALRPFAGLFGMIEGRLFGANAVGYRLVNLALHALNAALVFFLARRLLSPSRLLALGAALLFALHPVHVGAIGWLAGVSDLLPTSFFLGALLGFVRFRQHGRTLDVAVCICCGAVAIFSKENTVVLPVLFAAYDLLYTREWRPRAPLGAWVRRALPYVAFALLLLLYAALRRVAFGKRGGLPKRSQIFRKVTETAPDRYPEYMSDLIPRLDAVIPLPSAWNAALVLTCLVLLLPLVVALLKRRADLLRPMLFCGVGWLLITTLPFLLTYASARHLYPVAAGFCIFVAAVVSLATPERRAILRVSIFGILTAASVYITLQELKPWLRAGMITRDAHHSIKQLAGSPAGTPLILDLPPIVDAVITHAWTSPFLLDEPFYSPSLKERFIALEQPADYYRPLSWGQHPAIERLSRLDAVADAYLVTLDGERRVTTSVVSGARLKTAIAELREELTTKPNPPFDTHWNNFVQKLR